MLKGFSLAPHLLEHSLVFKLEQLCLLSQSSVTAVIITQLNLINKQYYFLCFGNLLCSCPRSSSKTQQGTLYSLPHYAFSQISPSVQCLSSKLFSRSADWLAGCCVKDIYRNNSRLFPFFLKLPSLLALMLQLFLILL